MSGKLVGWAFDVERLSPMEKLVLLALADNADRAGVCWPSQAELARKTGLGERTIRTHLRTFEIRTLLTKEPRLKIQGRGRASDLYRLAGGEDQPANDGRPTGDPSQDQPANDDTALYREPPEEPSGTIPLPSSPASVSGSDEVEAVWSAYVDALEKKGRGAELQADARKIIAAALKAGSVSELITCVATNAASDYHQKRGEFKHRKGGKYNSIGQILKPRARNGETQRSRIEWWLEKAEEQGLDQVEDADPNAEFRRIRREQGFDE